MKAFNFDPWMAKATDQAVAMVITLTEGDPVEIYSYATAVAWVVEQPDMHAAAEKETWEEASRRIRKGGLSPAQEAAVGWFNSLSAQEKEGIVATFAEEVLAMTDESNGVPAMMSDLFTMVQKLGGVAMPEGARAAILGGLHDQEAAWSEWYTLTLKRELTGSLSHLLYTAGCRKEVEHLVDGMRKMDARVAKQALYVRNCVVPSLGDERPELLYDGVISVSQSPAGNPWWRIFHQETLFPLEV